METFIAEGQGGIVTRAELPDGRIVAIKRPRHGHAKQFAIEVENTRYIAGYAFEHVIRYIDIQDDKIIMELAIKSLQNHVADGHLATIEHMHDIFSGIIQLHSINTGIDDFHFGNALIVDRDGMQRIVLSDFETVISAGTESEKRSNIQAAANWIVYGSYDEVDAMAYRFLRRMSIYGRMLEDDLANNIVSDAEGVREAIAAGNAEMTARSVDVCFDHLTPDVIASFMVCAALHTDEENVYLYLMERFSTTGTVSSSGWHGKTMTESLRGQFTPAIVVAAQHGRTSTIVKILAIGASQPTKTRAFKSLVQDTDLESYVFLLPDVGIEKVLPQLTGRAFDVAFQYSKETEQIEHVYEVSSVIELATYARQPNALEYIDPSRVRFTNDALKNEIDKMYEYGMNDEKKETLEKIMKWLQRAPRDASGAF